MADASAERQAKKARLDTPPPPNSKSRPSLSDACFAMSSLGRAKLGLHANSFCDVMPGVREVDAPITGKVGMLNRIAAADSLKFKWAGAPLLMLKLWILQKGLNTLSLVPLTEASTAAVLGSMAALFSIVCGATVTSMDAAVLHDSLPDSLDWAEQLVSSDHPLPPKGRASPQRTRMGGHMSLLGQQALREVFVKVSEVQHTVDVVISDWQCCLCR